MTKEEKEAIVAECRASGMTAKEWCQVKGIEYRKYCNWATRVNRKARKNEQGGWAKIPVAKSTENANRRNGIKLCCGNLTISVDPGFDPDMLLDILKVVNTLC